MHLRICQSAMASQTGKAIYIVEEIVGRVIMVKRMLITSQGPKQLDQSLTMPERKIISILMS